MSALQLNSAGTALNIKGGKLVLAEPGQPCCCESSCINDTVCPATTISVSFSGITVCTNCQNLGFGDCYGLLSFTCPAFTVTNTAGSCNWEKLNVGTLTYDYSLPLVPGDCSGGCHAITNQTFPLRFRLAGGVARLQTGPGDVWWLFVATLPGLCPGGYDNTLTCYSGVNPIGTGGKITLSW